MRDPHKGIVFQTDREMGFTPFEVKSCPIVDIEQDAVGHNMQTVPGFVFND